MWAYGVREDWEGLERREGRAGTEGREGKAAIGVTEEEIVREQ